MKQIDERVKNDEMYFKNYVDYNFDELFHRVEELEKNYCMLYDTLLKLDKMFKARHYGDGIGCE